VLKRELKAMVEQALEEELTEFTEELFCTGAD
jgi:hypothetical protein